MRHVVPTSVVILLVALGTVGVGYGLWAKTLTIEGQVHTGSVDARWTGRVCSEFNSWPDLPKDDEDDGEAEGKDVGEWSVTIDPDDDQILHFTLVNGYPSYAVDCQVHFKVEGTIPVVVRGTSIIPGNGLTHCTLDDLDSGNKKILRCDQLTVIFTDNLGSQLHPGEEAASSVTVHVEQAAEQEARYEFDIGVCLAQWNEEATAAECFAAAPSH